MRPAFCLVALAAGCSCPAPVEPTPVSRPGLGNVFRVTDGVYSGSTPEGVAGFQSLTDLGVRTVISVDGATPDVAAANAVGLRYVHLPIGYDGIAESRVIELAKALRDLPGPVFVHCHHGQHRGPAATAAAVRCLNPNFSADIAADFLKRAGTDPKYTGLYAVVARPPPPVDDSRIEFRPVADVPDLTKRMAEIDEVWDRLKKSPTPQDATVLVELFREVRRATGQRDEDFHRLLDGAIREAEHLERATRESRGTAAAVEKLAAACTNCHATFRDRAVSSTP